MTTPIKILSPFRYSQEFQAMCVLYAKAPQTGSHRLRALRPGAFLFIVNQMTNESFKNLRHGSHRWLRQVA